MIVYFNSTTFSRCTQNGTALIANAPTLYYHTRPTLELHIVDSSGTAVALNYAGYRVALDSDKLSTTPALARTPDSALGLAVDATQAASGILSVPLNLNTSECLAATDGKRNPVSALIGVWGITKEGAEDYIAELDVRLVSVVDPTGGDAPSSADPGYCTLGEVQAILNNSPAVSVSMETLTQTVTSGINTHNTATDAHSDEFADALETASNASAEAIAQHNADANTHAVLFADRAETVQHIQACATPVIVFNPLVAIYTHTLAADDQLYFDVSGLNSERAYTFELHLTMPVTPVSFAFPTGLLWLDNSAPDMSTGGECYWLVFRRIAGKWYGSLAAEVDA